MNPPIRRFLASWSGAVVEFSKISPNEKTLARGPLGSYVMPRQVLVCRSLRHAEGMQRSFGAKPGEPFPKSSNAFESF